MENFENVIYKVFINKKDLTISHQNFMNELGVSHEALNVADDLEQIELKFTALYAFKLVIMDRAFINGASMVLIGKPN